MSNNLANLMVGFGLDLSALQKDAPEAFRILNSQTIGMSAEMKRTSREGAESFRLIDEALGVHVSRPLTRILTQEFPGFAKALQSLLGVGVVGALGVAAFEGFEKVTKGIENAAKAQLEWQEAARKSESVFSDAMSSIHQKLASLHGQPEALKFRIEGAEEARRAIDQVSEALQGEQKAAEKAQSWSNKIFSGIGDFLGFLGRGAAAAIPDTAVGGHNFLQQIFDRKDQVDQLRTSLASMREILDDTLREDQQSGTHKALALINTDLERVQTNLRLMEQSGNQAGAEMARNAQKFLEDARDLENQTAALAHAQTTVANRHQLQEDMRAWNEENNKALLAWVKLNHELDEALKKLSSTKEWGERNKIYALPTAVLPPPGAPALKDQEELRKITGQVQGEDQVAQQTEAWKKAGQILEEIETPAQKYQIALATIKALHDQGRLSADQVALAIQKLGEQMTKAELHVLAMQKALEKLLQHSTSAADGARAFFLQLEISGSQNGKMVFDLLNTGLKGFEDETAKALFTGKAHWKDYFRSLTEEAFKFMLNKDIAGVMKLLSGTGLGKSLGLDKLLGGGPAAAAETANTLAVTRNTAALAANTAALAVAGAGGGSGALGDLAGMAKYAGFAAGTDDAPGGFAWVGEQGPELLNLPGGTSVTPASSLRSGGGGDSHYYIDAKGAELGVEEKIVRALAAARPRFIGEAVTSFHEIQRRTAGRSG